MAACLTSRPVTPRSGRATGWPLTNTVIGRVRSVAAAASTASVLFVTMYLSSLR
jgi:hypothetical protein